MRRFDTIAAACMLVLFGLVAGIFGAVAARNVLTVAFNSQLDDIASMAADLGTDAFRSLGDVEPQADMLYRYVEMQEYSLSLAARAVASINDYIPEDRRTKADSPVQEEITL